jgi:hypothetical protein
MKRANKVGLAAILLFAAVAIGGLVWSATSRPLPPAALLAALGRAGPVSEDEVSQIRKVCWPGAWKGQTQLSEAERTAFVETILVRQANESMPWHWSLADLLEVQIGSGLLTSSQLERYARAACPRPTVEPVFDLQPPNLDHAQDVAVWVKVPESRGAGSSFLRQTLTLTDMRMGGQVIPDHIIADLMPHGSLTPDGAAQEPRETHGGIMRVPLTLASGPHTWTYRVKREVRWEQDGKVQPIFEDEWDVTSTVTVAPPD